MHRFLQPKWGRNTGTIKANKEILKAGEKDVMVYKKQGSLS